MKTQKKTILIVDDEQRINAIYSRVLNEVGFLTRSAFNAHEATNILIREKIDLILLDIAIPGIDGRTIFEIIQEYDPLIKVIISSVYPLHVQKQMVPWAYDYFDKSHGLSVLLDKVSMIIENSAQN